MFPIVPHTPLVLVSLFLVFGALAHLERQHHRARRESLVAGTLSYPLINTLRVPSLYPLSSSVREETLAIAGTVYNCAPFLNDVFENIIQVARMFRRVHVVLAVDQGTDKSLEILQHWKRRFPDLHLLVDKRRSSLRTENLARARNRILFKLRELFHHSPFPYFIMMDCDDVTQPPIRLHLLQDVFQHTERWDSVSFPSLNSYYDIWALSVEPFFVSYRHFDDEPRANATMRAYIFNLLKREEWIPCHSAFGGFAVYRSAIFLECTYDWKFDQNVRFLTASQIQENERAMGMKIRHGLLDNQDCEHRFFHLTAVLQKGARIFIYPYNLFDVRDG